jgi:hypothetical protein
MKGDSEDLAASWFWVDYKSEFSAEISVDVMEGSRSFSVV